MLLGAVIGHAACNPTTDPDKTDIANARAAVAANCNCAGATSHGAYVSCAAQQANLTLVNKSCAGAVKRCAARSICGKPGAVTCCVTKTTGTTCHIKRDAAHCTAPAGGAACVGTYTSCCDACGSAGCATTTTTSSSTTTTTTTLPACSGDGGPCLNGQGCCPGLTCVPTGGPGGLAFCTSATCGYPTTVCRAVGAPGGLPCCPGFLCEQPNGYSGYPYDFCCTPPGGACSYNDCCAGTCTGGVCTGGTGCCQIGPYCADIYEFDTSCPSSAQNPGQVCDGATGTCSPARTGTGTCCQISSGTSQTCLEGPDAAISGFCTGTGYTPFPGQRCLASGACGAP